MAKVVAITAAVLLFLAVLTYASGPWKIFSLLKSDESRFTVLHDWPSDDGTYRTGYNDAVTASEISDVLLQAMGMFKRVLKWQGVQVRNLFKRPRASAVFMIDGLAEAVEVNAAKSYELSQDGLPGDVYSDILTMFGGIGSFVQHMSFLFEHKSVNVLLTADQKVCASTDAMNSNFDLEHSHELLLAAQKDWSVLKDIDFVFPVDIDDHGIATVTTTSYKATFDLTKLPDVTLFAELAMMKSAIKKLNMNKVIDSVPDAFVFAISSLQGIRVHYGSKSVQLKVASQLAVASVEQMSSELVDLYHGDVLVQLLSLVWKDGQEYNGEVYSEDLDYLCGTYFSTYVTHLVACRDNQCKLVMCESYPTDYSNRLRRDFEAENTTDTVPERSYSRTENFSAFVGIITFITVFLIAAIFGISWAMWMIDPGEDSIIYQMTAPRPKTE